MFLDADAFWPMLCPSQVHKEALGSPQQEGYTCILPRQGVASSSGSSSSSNSGGPAAAEVEVQRGYGPAAVHAMPAESCQLMTRRSAGAWAIPETDRVAALRVSGTVGVEQGSWRVRVGQCCKCILSGQPCLHLCLTLPVSIRTH